VQQHWTPAYVGLGSNLGDPQRQLREALRDIGKLPDARLIAVSSFYENPPFGPVVQPDFVNAVAGILARHTASALLGELRRIEAAHGRDRTPGHKWGPRTLDLDLLVFGAETSDTEQLRLPHPGIRDRNFVLLPLAEIAPALLIPGVGVAAALAAQCDGASLRRIANSEPC
jgi:2-amino-4-hydroxy-6-hydroxymethyldihydropteridine diphosphokinase